MTLFEIYNERKGALLAKLENARSLAEAAGLLSDFLDTLQYSYAESCKLDALRGASAYMISAVKSTFPLLECASDVKLWETDEQGSPRPPKNNLGAALLLILLGLLAVAGVIYFYLYEGIFSNLERYRFGLYALLLACGLFVLAGALLTKQKKSGKKRSQITVGLNAADVVRRLVAVVLQIDKNLSAVEADELNRKSEELPAFTAEQLELFTQLLEGRYSENDELARESITELERYLHNSGVEIIEYDRVNAQYFDLLPSSEGEKTLRPALMSEGRVIKRGLATQSVTEA